MAEQNNENLDSEIEELVEELELENNSEESTNESTEEVDEEKARLKDLNKKLYARAKKAEGFEFKDGKWVKPEKKETQSKVEPKTISKSEPKLSVQDFYSLTKNNISEEDIEDVTEFATFKKISISEALKSPTLKAILSEKAEKRSIAEATHTGTSTRGTAKVSDETLLSNARKGIMPEKEEDIARLARIRKGLK